jgi:hypothetical protein
MRGITAALVGGIGLLTAAAAFAAGPAFQERETFTEEDPNFCGTGETVVVEGTVLYQAWIGTTGGDPTQEIKSMLNIHITYTNPDTGASVVERWSHMNTNEIISGLESGIHTHEFTERGLKAMFRLKNGGLLARDAGSLTYRVTFDANDQVTGFEVVSVRGPHPGFAYEGDLFCDTVVPALGLD